MPEIRCANKKFGEITTQSKGILEAICTSRFCKIHKDEVVLHRWDLSQLNSNGTVKMTDTKRFKRPVMRGNSQ